MSEPEDAPTPPEAEEGEGTAEAEPAARGTPSRMLSALLVPVRIAVVLQKVVIALLVAILILATGAWGALAIHFSNLPFPWLRTAVAVVFVGGFLGAFLFVPRRWRTVRIYGVTFVVLLLWWILIPASHDRVWIPHHERMPRVEFDGDRFTIHDFRDFYWTGEEEFEPRWKTVSFDLNEIVGVDFGLSHWMENAPIAHFLLSFGFEDGRYICVSVETRREADEPWDALRGFFKQYELIMLLGDERDFIGRRLCFSHNQIYLYPSRNSPERARTMLLAILHDVNELYEKPRWYNTVTHNCTTSLLPFIRRHDARFDIRLLLNGMGDELAYERGAIDTDLPFEEARKFFHINQYAENFPHAEDFSRRIRPHLRR